MTAQKTCPDKTELESMLTGTLPPDDQTRVSLHLEDCATCQTMFEELADGSPWLPDRRGSSASEPESALLRLMERLAGEGPDGAANAEPADGEPYLPFLTPSDNPDYLGQLGPYNVIAMIGQGGMGIVLKAHDPRLNRFVAIKVLAPQLAVFAGARKRFLREAQSVAAVGHDQIVTIHSVDEVRGFPFIVMEYVTGVSLAERIASNGPLGLRETLRIGTQIATGLAAAHARGLIHRDIKPANILLESGGKVKVTDFGLARAVGESQITHTGQITGTPEFMSPEQARGQSLDHRSDLFSLGSVLYTMYTGRSPFRGATAWESIGRVCNESPRPLRETNPRTPEWLVDLIDRLLAKSPADRLQSATEVAELIARRLADLPPTDNDDKPTCKPELSPRRRKPWLAASVALLMLFGIIAVWQIVIHIKRQGDVGPETTLSVVEGSKVAVHNDGRIDVQLPPKDDKTPAAATPISDADKIAALKGLADKAMDEDAPMGGMLGSKTIKRFGPGDRLLTTDGVTPDNDGWRIESTGNRTVKLFEIRDPDAINSWLMVHASVNTEKLDGKAELALWCHTRDGNVYRGNAPDPLEVPSVKDWATYSALFKMRRGDRPTLIEVGVAIEGQGTAEIKNLRVNRVPLSNIGEATAYGPAEKLKRFDALAEPSTTEGIVREKDGWRIEAKGNRTVRLFDIPTPRRVNEMHWCGLFGRAKLKTENLDGRAYLAIGTNEPYGKESIASGCFAQGGTGLPRGPATGTTDWTSYESTDGHVGEGGMGWWKVVKLNLVIEGHGTVWIKDIDLLAAPTLPQSSAAPSPGATSANPYNANAYNTAPPTTSPYPVAPAPAASPYVDTRPRIPPPPIASAAPVVTPPNPYESASEDKGAALQDALQKAFNKAFDDDNSEFAKAIGKKTLRKFTPGDKLLTTDGVASQKDFWNIEVKGNRTIKLFEIRNPDAINSWLMYDAELRLDKLDGKAELAMWCHTRDGNTYRTNAMPAPDVNSLSQWAPYNSVFKMRRGDRPTLIEIGVAVEGQGTLEIKDIRVYRMALQNEGTAYGPAQKLKDFNAIAEPTTAEGVFKEKDGWRIEAKSDRTIQLFSILTPRNHDAATNFALFGRAKLKTKDLIGRAYFDIGSVDSAGKEHFVQHGFRPGFGRSYGPVSETTDWATYESADPNISSNDIANGRWKVVKLNLVIEGHGTVWIKDIGLFRAAKIDPPPASAPLPVTSSPASISDVATLCQEGWQLWQIGRPTDAVPKFEAAVKLAPDNADVWNGLGWATFNCGRSAEAKKAFEQTIAVNPNHPGGLNGLGQLYLSQHKYDLAEPHLLKAAPQASAAWWGLARIYLLQGKFDKAEPWAQRIIDSGAGDTKIAQKMLQAAKDRKLSEGLRVIIEPPPSTSAPSTVSPPLGKPSASSETKDKRP